MLCCMRNISKMQVVHHKSTQYLAGLVLSLTFAWTSQKLLKCLIVFFSKIWEWSKEYLAFQWKKTHTDVHTWVYKVSNFWTQLQKNNGLSIFKCYVVVFLFPSDRLFFFCLFAPCRSIFKLTLDQFNVPVTKRWPAKCLPQVMTSFITAQQAESTVHSDHSASLDSRVIHRPILRGFS